MVVVVDGRGQRTGRAPPAFECSMATIDDDDDDDDDD
jgi:hypothetical protein